jgi:hypothetical protein
MLPWHMNPSPRPYSSTNGSTSPALRPTDIPSAGSPRRYQTLPRPPRGPLPAWNSQASNIWCTRGTKSHANRIARIYTPRPLLVAAPRSQYTGSLHPNGSMHCTDSGFTIWSIRDCGSGFRVQGSGFRVQGSGFRVQGSGFRVQGSGFR